MKTILLIALCVIAFATASAQSVIDYRTVAEIVAEKDSITFDQKTKTAMAFFAGELPEEIKKDEKTVTMFFKRYGSKVTISKDTYEKYCKRALEHQVKVIDKSVKKYSW